MKVTVKATGVAEVMAMLRYKAVKVPEAGRKAMHRGADRVVKEAQLNAPVDKHNLEQSIRKEISYGTRGRLQINIVAGGYVNGVNVENYVALVHENYSSMTPGPGTRAKQQANPGRLVGEKFLERALRDNAKFVNNEILVAVMKEAEN